MTKRRKKLIYTLLKSILFDFRWHSRKIYRWLKMTSQPDDHIQWNSKASLHALGLIRAPNLGRFPVHHQFAVIGQLNTAHVTFGFAGVCVPQGVIRVVVHDQVAVSLHTQADSIWSLSVWSPHRLPAIDDKVTIILQAEKETSDCYQNVHFQTLVLLLLHLLLHWPVHMYPASWVHKYSELLTWKTAFHSPLLDSR